ncbi:flagellar motor protein [Paenibacillus sediminis]|uniref:Chemotaxis protein MotA n=1 Tax=Paenibacillus sediminis TaxID=664909 RepID=A0ABS4H273_9BACL|nr:flagellar motor protein [Paenibacillus sediminis]MBP1936620.1 chemotaxis protein MotA [Paenibacillus sediminis]
MDITIIAGLIFGLAALIGGFLWEGGQFGGLMQATAALIVFGGTIAAVIISFPASKLRTIPAALRMAFGRQEIDHESLINDLVNMATTARRAGVLELERVANNHPNDFVREGIGLVVDGTDQALVKELLELEIDKEEAKHEGYAKIFESAGGYAPTMGIIGTVMGLIHVLSSLTDPTQLGPAIAVAFTATLYGVASANLIFLPIASKIKERSQEELQHLEMILQGVLSVQNGENPILIRKKLMTFADKSPEKDSFSPLVRREWNETAK